MNTAMIILLIFSLAMILVYPVYVFGSLFFLSRKTTRTDTGKNFEAPVSIILVGYNEAAFIRQKVISLLDDEEWIEGSELIIASGGSSDGTNEILETFRDHPRVRLFIFPQRLTKIAGVNFAVAQSRNDILVFSDCRQRMKKGSVRKLVNRFADESIGTVSATLTDRNRKGRLSFSRNVLNRLAFAESRFGSSLNIFGALYAQRKSVYRPVPDDVLFDDLFVTVSTIAQGKRLVQEPEAQINDIAFETYYNRERIERLARGLLVYMARHFSAIRQLPFGTMLRFLIYKYVKLFVPFLLLPALAAAFYLMPVHVLFPCMATAGLLLLIFILIPGFRKGLFLMLRIQLGFFSAVSRFIFWRQRSVSWQKLDANQLNETGSV